MGGDEVPEGAWERSPAVQQLLKSDPTVKDLRGLWTHFFVRVRDILKKRGIALYGWEELVMEKASLEGSRVVSTKADFIRDGGMVDAWWNDKPNEGVPYSIANAGYRTVLTCFDYFYFDLSNLPSFDEPGDAWVGYLDVMKTFSFIPYDYYRNNFTSMRGVRYPENYFKDKTKLREEAKKNIMGIQGALWGENLTEPELFEYQVFPRVMAVAERGWAKDPDWATASAAEYDRAFTRDWSAFANVLGKRELPKLDFYHGGYGYRVPPPGVKRIDGKIMANALFPGMIIRYTTDGSEPTVNSMRYSEPIVAKGTIRFKCFATNGRASVDVRIEN
jgi:hexosaminidase